MVSRPQRISGRGGGFAREAREFERLVPRGGERLRPGFLAERVGGLAPFPDSPRRFVRPRSTREETDAARLPDRSPAILPGPDGNRAGAQSSEERRGGEECGS